MRFLTPLLLSSLCFGICVGIAAAGAPPRDPIRIVPTPSACAVVLEGVGDEYRVERLVDGGVILSFEKVGDFPAQERAVAGTCLSKLRVSPQANREGVAVELRPAGCEFSALIHSGSTLTVSFEKVFEIGAPAGVTDKSYRIGIGDQLQITVYAQDDLTKKVTVGTDGMIDYPLLGGVQAAGLTIRELQESLTTALAKDYLVNPQVSVDVERYKSQTVLVIGPVKTPGKVALEGGTSLKDALAAAGGFTNDAGYVITVARRVTGADGAARDPEQMNFSRAEIETGLANLDLRPDDVVTVSPKDYFYIQAEVRKPGKYEIQPGLTLLQAIAVAEGLTDWADKKSIQLIRKSGGTQLVNLKNIEKQKTPDVELAAGDIIIVHRRIL